MQCSRRVMIGGLAGLLASVSGCGGGDGSSATRTTPVKATINWAARGRALDAPSSALSVVLTFAQANADGSDAQFIVNRRTDPAAYTENWTSPTEIKVGTFTLTARFYASANGQDALVGTASATVAIQSDGSGVGILTTQGTVASVEILSIPNLLPYRTFNPLFQVRDAQNNLLAISLGSAVFAVTAGSDIARIENGALVTTGWGSITLTATVDGKTSAPFTVEIPYRGVATDAAWAKSRADAANTGRGKGQGATGVERWRLPLTLYNWDIPAPVITADGRAIYSMHAPPSQVSVNILDMATGQYIQRFPTPAAFSVLAPTLGADGTIYMTGDYPSSRNILYALNGTTGAERWSFDPPVGILLSPPALSPDGRVYVADSANFYALDNQTGVEQWRRQIAGATMPAIGKDGTVYTAAAIILYALATLDGTPLWQYGIGTGSSVPPVYDATLNQVYVGDANGIVHAINAANGQRVWQRGVDSARVTSLALGTNGRLYAGSQSGRVAGLGASDGALVWTFTEGTAAAQLSIAMDGTVYATAGGLYALDGTSGAKRWELPPQFTGEPAIALDGTIFQHKFDTTGLGVPSAEAIVGVR